jgi:DNA-binding protein YbaB
VTYSAAQTAGDLNVIAIGWEDSTHQIQSVTDTKGNVYAVAASSRTSGSHSLAIYYAKNIIAAAAGANTVTVTFNGSTTFPDIRILEYSGVDTTNPLDVSVGAGGNSTALNSGSVTTTNANDLLVAANEIAHTTNGTDSNFTQRLQTDNQNIIEDRIVTATGSYSATATQQAAGDWVMEMVAFKAASTGDTQAPTAPTNLTATAASSSQINLSWTASTDNVGVANYRVERCQGASCSNFAQIATPTGTTYSDTGLSASTSYSYRVRAADAVPNLSGYSNTASASTSTQAIAYVQGNYAVADPASTIQATYSSAQLAGDLNVVVVAWANNTVHLTSVTDSKGNSYALAVGPTASQGSTQSIYYAKNIAAATAGANAVTVSFDGSAASLDVRIAEYSGVDTVSPLDQTSAAFGTSSLASTGPVTTTSANEVLVAGVYTWTSVAGAGTGYTQRIFTTWNDSLEDRIVTTTGSYSATAPQTSSNLWFISLATFKAATGGGGGDTQAPTAPSNLSATTASSTQINMSWTGSTDNVGVANYRVERCQGTGCSNFTQIATPTTTSYSDTGLTSSTSYSYRVRAADAVPNLSGYSNTATATTNTGDTQAPTAPSNLAASAISSGQVNLSWTGSTDNVGVTAYRVERCQGGGCSSFAQIASIASTTYSDTTVSASTTYLYRVRATDAASNLSGYSNTATATIAAALGVGQTSSADPQSSATSVSATFAGAQTAGDTNVIAIGWRTPTASIQSVTDSRGNVYVPAVGPTVLPGVGASAIYYSSGIVAAGAGTNAVTVTFNTSASLPDIRIAEYSGIDTSGPIDVIASATGSGTTSDSGTIATFTPSTLIVAANLVTTSTSGAGSGYTARAISSPDGNILEDRIVSAAGNYNATAPLSASGQWIMQLVAFRWIGSPPCD